MAMNLIDVEWLTGDEAMLSLELPDEDDDACVLHVRVSVDDCQKGRLYSIQLVDMDGDPDGEAWLRANEPLVLDHFDAHQARERGWWC